MVLWHNNTREGIERDITSYPNFVDWKQRGTSFENMATYRNANLSITDGGEPEQVPAVMTSIDFFATLGVLPRIGRAFTPEELQPGNDRAVILSHGVWQRRFDGIGPTSWLVLSRTRPQGSLLPWGLVCPACRGGRIWCEEKAAA